MISTAIKPGFKSSPFRRIFPSPPTITHRDIIIQRCAVVDLAQTPTTTIKHLTSDTTDRYVTKKETVGPNAAQSKNEAVRVTSMSCVNTDHDTLDGERIYYVQSPHQTAWQTVQCLSTIKHRLTWAIAESHPARAPYIGRSSALIGAEVGRPAYRTTPLYYSQHLLRPDQVRLRAG